MGQDTERPLMMPPAPPAPFVIAQPEGVFAVFEAGLDGPPPPAQPHQRGQRGDFGRLGSPRQYPATQVWVPDRRFEMRPRRGPNLAGN